MDVGLECPWYLHPRAVDCVLCTHDLLVMSLTATIRMPTIAISMTADRMAAYSFSAPVSPVYSAIVGARTDASTITLVDLGLSPCISNGNCDDCRNNACHICHLTPPPFSLILSVGVSVNRNDDKAKDAEQNTHSDKARPCLTIGEVSDPASFMGERIHDVLCNRGEE